MKPLTLDVVEIRLRKAIDDGDEARITALGRQVDGLDTAKSRPALAASALWYAEQGLRVFPLMPGRKTPFPRSHGCKDATSEAAQVRAWWEVTPEANIGLATGHLVDVIDVDGAVGVKSWAEVKDDLPPILGHVDTPRPGGSHLYIAATGEGNSAGMFPGVDYRGVGGYVVAPPSINADGVAYSWTRPLDLAASA